MQIVEPQPQRGRVIAGAVVIGAMALLTAVEVHGTGVRLAAPVIAITVVTAVAYRVLLAWRSLVAMLVLVILFIPIKRYTLPTSLPFQLEPYRVLVALVAFGWATSLLIDRRVRLRRSGFDAPLLAYVIAIAISLLVNPGRVSAVGSDVIKTLLFFASFIIVFYLVVSVLLRRRDIDFIVAFLVVGGVILAVLAVVESRTGYNVFNHLSGVLPFLQFQGAPALDRSGRLRVLASAQHPIALGAAFVMLIPLAVYLAQTTKRRAWWAVVLFLGLGALTTSSRTAITMMVCVFLVYLSLHARRLKRFWPALIPALAVVHFAVPGALGTTFSSFFPKGGLIAQQKDAPAGHARLSTLGPTLRNEVAVDPAFGVGFATRITTPSPTTPVPNAPILDDQWLGVFAETGVVGLSALLWLFISFLRRLTRAARRDSTQRLWLLTGAAASVTAYGVGMFTYDAFSFIQATFLFFIILGLGAAALRAEPAEWQSEPAATEGTLFKVGARLRPVAGTVPIYAERSQTEPSKRVLRQREST